MEKPEIPENLLELTVLRRRELYRRQKEWVEECMARQERYYYVVMTTEHYIPGMLSEYNNLSQDIIDATEEKHRIRVAITTAVEL